MDRNLAFVKKIRDIISDHPDLVPNHVDKDLFIARFEAHQRLLNFQLEMEQFYQTIRDTSLIVGDRVMEESLSTYRKIRAASVDNLPGARPIYDMLSRHFAKTISQSDEGEANADPNHQPDDVAGDIGIDEEGIS